FIHYTDWIPAHIHMGTMGWVSMICFASIYYLVPRIYGKKVFSIPLANLQFWLILIGQLIWSFSLWIAGVLQAGMWTAMNPDGSLTYTFMETMVEMYPYWWIRAIGGLIYFAGIIIFVYNLVMTVRNGEPASTEAAAEGRA
ncbi:MAG: cbb3-type cytochrome c oxidase subunit I, partial [Desulfobulbaceae bacterium]|nr:cbb3-type cytochrome c oxidase subunit I [Desulfobulbaceae bacterium]